MEHTKSDQLNKMLRTLPFVAAALVLCLIAGLAPRAHAGAYTYAARQRTINAGILMVDDANSGVTIAEQDPSPFVFYVLNQRTDIEPQGWNIVNPLAPHLVTGTILNRWNTLVPNSLTLNEPITPNMAPYWEVSLSSTSLTDLEQYNVLLLNLQSLVSVSFTDAEVTELRRYVDNGGQLWIEDSGATISTTNPLFLKINFDNAAGATAGVVLPSVGSVLLHQSIIDAPYLLTNTQLDALGNSTHTDVITALTSNVQPNTGEVSTVVGQPTADLPVVSSGQFGAGQVIVESLGCATYINNSVSANGLNPGPYTTNVFTRAPAADLEFVSDIMSWTSAHPNEYQTSHQSSQSPNTLGPALTPTWTYTAATSGVAGTAEPGAAVNGSFIYVRDVDGYLRCFNATPGTDIIGEQDVDAGVQDYSLGDPYDEVWGTDGAADGFAGVPVQAFHDPFGSAPTVVTGCPPLTSSPNTPVANQVFIESSTGAVYDFDATTGGAGAYGTVLGGGGGGAAYNQGTGPAPAPTYYNGRLYAGQPDGSLFVYDLRTQTAFPNFPVDTASGGYVTQPPTAGIVHENRRGNQGVYSDDLVVTVTTNDGTFTLEGGSFHDYLVPPTGTLTPGVPVTCKPVAANQASVNTPFEISDDTTAQDYDDSTNGYQFNLGNTMVAGTGIGYVGFQIDPANAQPYFGDFDVDFADSPPANGQTTDANSLIRDQFTTGATPTTILPAVSAPALDSNGNFYYTVNVTGAPGADGVGATSIDSSVVCVHDGSYGETAPNGRLNATQMQWRFRLPYTSEGAVVDNDGVNYGPLDGYQFVGAPVVDDLGDVYALATYTNPQTGLADAAVLCFNATGEVYIHLPVDSENGTLQVSTLNQPLTGTVTNVDEFGNPLVPVFGAGSQYNGRVDQYGDMQIQSFGSNAPNNAPPTTTPNLSEPESVEATYTLNVNGGTSSSVIQAPMHTNMTWFAVVPTSVDLYGYPNSIQATPSLTLVGNYLFFADTNGNIYRVNAYPQNAGLVNGTRQVALWSGTIGTPLTNTAATDNGIPLVGIVSTLVGSINGVLSAGNGVLIANGLDGIAAFGSQSDLVADSTRVLEVDSEGDATWAVDSTAETNPTTGLTTHLALNQPRDITQVTANDYLVADTGNNRCVRFNRAGDVLWELSNFNDVGIPASETTAFQDLGINKPAPLLAPGEPLTLNHPTSVTAYVHPVFNAANVLQGTVVHYLIADTGNDRIIEVADAFDADGDPIGPQHNLIWVSHTYDALGRKYAYTSANYYTGPNGLAYIAALVTNVRIGSIPSPGKMLSVNADSPGSSIVLLDYDPTLANTATQANGYISHTISTFLAFENASGNFQLDEAPLETQAETRLAPGTTPVTLYLRNPRFLQTYTPPGASTTTPVQNFLLADDNGVFDLFLNSSTQLEAQWGFTQADYQALALYTNIEEAISPLPLAPIYNGLGGIEEDPGTTTPVTRAGLIPSIPGEGIPFIPNSIQRVTTDTVPFGTTNYLIGRYVVTNGYSTGSVTPTTGFGGEAITLAVPPGQTGNLYTGLVSAFGDLGNTAPLSQPTYAGQEK